MATKSLGQLRKEDDEDCCLILRKINDILSIEDENLINNLVYWMHTVMGETGIHGNYTYSHREKNLSV